MLTVNKKQLCEDEHIAAGFRLCEVIRDYGYDAYLVGVDIGCGMLVAKLKDTVEIEKIIKPVYNFKAAF